MSIEKIQNWNKLWSRVSYIKLTKVNANDKGIGKPVHLHTDEGNTKSVQSYCQIVSKDIKNVLLFVSKLLREEISQESKISEKGKEYSLLYLLPLYWLR